MREIMGSLHRLDGSGEAQRILRQRLDQVATRTVGLLRAGADLAAVVTAAPEPTAIWSVSGDVGPGDDGS
ncbi:hypothetical protein [Streptomyces sp. I05A-00742]|uniref:hypothetical protein n=1 Tax=Streptomyces sp. I05A-00742 TaxID=2732853 RepID=UPI00289A7367|nr:hypothetical protein [Streptomyces sp. I05A-00742]